MAKKVTKKQKKKLSLFYSISMFIFLIGVLLVRYFSPELTSTSNIIMLSLLGAALLIHILVLKYRLIHTIISYGIIISISFALFLGGQYFYKDFIQFHNLEKKMGIDNIYFYGDVDKEVLAFLNNINSSYTKGIHNIIFLPASPFSYTIEVDGEIIGGGSIKGEFRSDAKDVFVVIDDNYPFHFYHEVGHYIYNYSLTDEDRLQWKEALNFSGQIKDAAKEINISEEEFLSRYNDSIQRETIEKFADGFASVILNESLIPEHPGKEYLKQIAGRFK